MENGLVTEKEVKKVDRSSRYPSIGLASAIKFIQEARTFGRKTSDVHIAGKGSPKGGAYIRKRAALGYYGLLEGRGQNLYISDLAESILFPQSEEERLSSVRNAFLTPDLFNHLYQETEKNVAIDLDVLGNIVVRQYGITPAAKEEFITVFIKSGIYAEVVAYSDETKSSIILIDNHSTEEIKEKEGYKGAVKIDKKKEEFGSSELQTVELSLTQGQAKIIVPAKITALDVKKLKAQIDVLATDFDDNDAAG